MPTPSSSTSQVVFPGTTDRPRGIVVDETGFPIVKLRILPELTLADIDATYDRLEELVREARPHVHWSDLRAVNPLRLSAVLRKRFAEREKMLYRSGRGIIRGDVRIVDDPLVRNVLTAFEWLTGQAPWPVGNVASEQAAMAWLKGQRLA